MLILLFSEVSVVSTQGREGGRGEGGRDERGGGAND